MIDLKGAIGIRSALSLEDYHELPARSAHNLVASAENCEKAQYDDEHPKLLKSEILLQTFLS